MSANSSVMVVARRARPVSARKATRSRKRPVIRWTVAVLAYLAMAAALYYAPRGFAIIKSWRRTEVNYIDAGRLADELARMAHSSAREAGAFRPVAHITTPDVRSVHLEVVGP